MLRYQFILVIFQGGGGVGAFWAHCPLSLDPRMKPVQFCTGFIVRITYYYTTIRNYFYFEKFIFKPCCQLIFESSYLKEA